MAFIYSLHIYMLFNDANMQDSTFINDAARLWNVAPAAIKNCKTLFAAKKQIKIFVRTLPI